MSDKKKYSMFDVDHLTNSEIKELKINKIITTANFDNTTVSERLICENVDDNQIRSILNHLNLKTNGYSIYCYMAATEDYELYRLEY